MNRFRPSLIALLVFHATIIALAALQASAAWAQKGSRTPASAPAAEPAAPAPQRAVIGRSGLEFEVVNRSPGSLWVTFYELGAKGKTIAGAACAQPGGSVQIFANPGSPIVPGSGTYWVRGELTKNANCQQPLACDTSTSLGENSLKAGRSPRVMYFFSDPQRCWLDRRF